MTDSKANGLEILAIGVAAFVLCAVATWPVVIHPADFVVGASHNDHASLIWTLDFVAQRIAQGDFPWGFTERIEAPEGVWLYPAALPLALFVAPVTLLFGPFHAFNLLAIFNLVLTATCTWGWLRSEGVARSSAACGSFTVLLAPALAMGTFNGNPDVTAWFWIPLTLWFLTHPTRNRVLFACATILVGALCSPYIGVMAVVAAMALLLQRRQWRSLALVSGVTLLAAFVLIAVLFPSFQDTGSAIIKGPAQGGMGTASLISLFHPRPLIIPTDSEWSLTQVGTGSYLGLGALLIVALTRPKDSAWAWLLVLIGVIVALGPELRLYDPPPSPPPIHGGPSGDVSLGSVSVPLPWRLTHWLPGLNALQLTARFTGLAAVGLAYLVATAAEQHSRHAWTFAIAIVLDLGLVAGGIGMWKAAPAWDDDSCSLFVGQPEGAVLDLPPTFHELGMLTSVCHNNPVAEGINRPLPPSVRDRFHSLGPVLALPSAHAQGYRWALFHQSLPHQQYRDLLPENSRCEVARNEQAVLVDLECLARSVP